MLSWRHGTRAGVKALKDPCNELWADGRDSWITKGRRRCESIKLL